MAGRKRKVEGELREPICFSVSRDTKRMAAELRKAGVDVSHLVCSVIAMKYGGMFCEKDTRKMDEASRHYTCAIRNK